MVTTALPVGHPPEAVADFIQLAHDAGAAGAMDCAIHATAAAQAGIRGVDDGVHADLGDVADHQTEFLSVREIDLHAVIVSARRHVLRARASELEHRAMRCLAPAIVKGWNKTTH